MLWWPVIFTSITILIHNFNTVSFLTFMFFFKISLPLFIYLSIYVIQV